MVEPSHLLLYNNEAQRRGKMSKNTKIRGLVWLALVIIVVISVGSASYSVQTTNIDFVELFEGKTETQVGLELLEIFSNEYEERPIISEIRPSYSFNVHRLIQNRPSQNTELFIYFREVELIEVDGVIQPSVGFLDSFVYCIAADNSFNLISNTEIQQITGTNVFAGFLSLTRELVTNCENNEFVLVVDTPKEFDATQGVPELSSENVLEFIVLSDLYDLQAVASATLLSETVVLNAGFNGDLSQSSYNVLSIQQAIVNATIAVPLVTPIAFGLWYATEKELFNEGVRLPIKSLFNKKKNGK
jgi:hypothetical protein